MTPDGRTHDAVVVGGGPAGLSAALWLGRYRRRTAIIDAGRQRNLASRAVHGYASRDGMAPAELLEELRRETVAYPTVELLHQEAHEIVERDGLFDIRTSDRRMRAARIVLALGVVDETPEIPGFDRHYGRNIFHCSCCDGYETRDKDVVAIGWGEHVAGFALDLLDWGARVTLVTNGETFDGDQSCRIALRQNAIEVVEEKVTEIVSEGSEMHGVRVESGREIPGARAFFSIAHHPRNDLARALGCKTDELGYVETDPHGETSVKHVYAAGDITPGEQLVQTATAQGAVAGIACGMSLRGSHTAEGAPDPGPDPEGELATS